MGVVLKAHNLALDEHVAIKILREDVQLDDDNIARFLREAKNAVRLKSEHVARVSRRRHARRRPAVHGHGAARGPGPRQALLDDTAGSTPVHAVDLVLQACEAIAEAHSLGIVHRDIKPTNLFLDAARDGTPIAQGARLRHLEGAVTRRRHVAARRRRRCSARPRTCRPEQMRSARTVDARTDIWSLGVRALRAGRGRAAVRRRQLRRAVRDGRDRAARARSSTRPSSRRSSTAASRSPSTIATRTSASSPRRSSRSHPIPQRAQREVTRIQRMVANAPGPSRCDAVAARGRVHAPIPRTPPRGRAGDPGTPAPAATRHVEA